MKKTVAIMLALLLILTGCSSKEADPTVATQARDYIAAIRADLLSEDTPLARAMDEALVLTLDGEGDGTVTVTVTAPDICQGALAWFEAVSDEDYSDEALTQQMLTLLEGETQSRQFTLEVRDGQIVYTNDFLNAASCGLRRFHTALTVMFMEEMEASIDD